MVRASQQRLFPIDVNVSICFLPFSLSAITVYYCLCFILQFDTTLPVCWRSKIPEHKLLLKCNTRTNTINIKKTQLLLWLNKTGSFNACVPPPSAQQRNVYFAPRSRSFCGLILYAGSSGSGQRGPHCRVAQQCPQGQPLCSRSRGANPPPCVPASFCMSSYVCHMWSRRKADAVFPFVKSSFWKDFSILMARTESPGAKGWRKSKRAAQPLSANTASFTHC